MKSRAVRHKVLVKARMNAGGRWHDVCILNYSPHGLGLACDDAPPRGAYLEVRRGPYSIVARVAWSKGHRFGAVTQDPVAAVAIVGTLEGAPTSAPKTEAFERRQAPRPAQRSADSSRHRGRAVEFVGVGLLVLGFAGLAAEMVAAAFGTPMARVRAALVVSDP